MGWMSVDLDLYQYIENREDNCCELDSKIGESNKLVIIFTKLH